MSLQEAGLQIVQQSASGVVRLTLTGELDIATSGQLRAAMVYAVAVPGAATVIVDLAEVTFCDSSGIGALIQGRAAAAGHGVAYQVVNPTGAVRRVLEITGMLTELCDVPEPPT
jgi:anti-sigma B factor antagonist